MNPRIDDVAGKRILYVMAAPAEYGPELAARIVPLMTGIGPVEAAIATTRTLAALAGCDQLPDLLVSLGSAGSARLDHCGVYQATAVSWRDMDASALGFPKGQVPLLDLPPVLPLPLRIPGIAEATLSTGANVVSGRGYDGIDADMVDMESYAVLRACQGFGVSMIALRGISDGRADLGGLADWTRYLHVIDAKLAASLDELTRALRAGVMTLPPRPER